MVVSPPEPAAPRSQPDRRGVVLGAVAVVVFALTAAVWAHLDAEQSDDLTEVTITGDDSDTTRWIGALALA